MGNEEISIGKKQALKLFAAKSFCAQFIGIVFAYLLAKDELLSLCMGSVMNFAYILGECIYTDWDEN